MPIICLLGLLLLLLLLLVLETLSILVIGSWIPHARSTGARILKLYCYRSAGVRILELYTFFND